MKKNNLPIRFLMRLTRLPRFVMDPAVGFVSKLVVLLMLGYIISPVDLIPEPIIGLGLIDDAILTIYIVSTISDKLDRYIELDQEEKNKQPIIDAEYRVIDDDDKDSKE